MAYLTFAGSEEKQTTCFKFIGADTKVVSTSLLSDNQGAPVSLLASNNGAGVDSCSFYDGPSDYTIFAFGESTETSGAIAYSSGSTETCGSIAMSVDCGVSCSVSTSVSTSFSCSV